MIYKRIILAFTFTVSYFINYASAQVSFLYKDDVAVFYPEEFNASQMLPSFAIVRNLQPQDSLPAQWTIRPKFLKEKEKNIISITFDGNADLYGTGEVTGDLRRNETDIDLWNSDNYAYSNYDGKRLYQSHPWILGVRKNGTSFGILVDNTWRQHFDLKNPITISTDGPAPRVVVIEENSPQEVVRKLAYLTGTMELPPLWALGFHQCRFSYFPDTKVKEIASEFRRRQIPCDAIWMDIDYMNDFRVFTFDAIKFPDPKGLNDYLHNKDFKSVYMIDPGIKKDSTYFVFQQGVRGDYWVKDSIGQPYVGRVWPGNCQFPDFTRPDVRNWWSGLYKEFMFQGVDGVWNDMNEPAVFEAEGITMPANNIHAGGAELPAGTHARYHNVYGMLMVKASREGILKANPDKRPFVLSRSNFLGGQRYGATWTGDNASTWDYLRVSIPMTINLSLSGQPFNGPDIGGFSQNCNEELLIQWMAVGAFYPFARNHSANGTSNQEPWAMGKKAESVSRTALNRRYRLLPYLYTLFREASQTGIPVMQPVFFSDIKDTTLRREQECFTLGNNLLIIPRWSSKQALPKGDWDILKLEDMDDGYQPYVALRPGAIVPIGKIIQSTNAYRSDSITLLINPMSDGSAEGELYDDAGDGFGYQQGDYSLCHFKSYKDKNNLLKVKISQVEGNRSAQRVYRVGYVTDGKIKYGKWSLSPILYTKIISDKQQCINLSKLKMSSVNFAKCKSLRKIIINHKIKTKDGDFF